MANIKKVFTAFSDSYMDTLRDLEAVEFTTINGAYNDVLAKLDLDNLDIDDARIRFWDFSVVIGMLIETVQFYLIKVGLESSQIMLDTLQRGYKRLNAEDLISLTGMEGNEERSIHLELDERIQDRLDAVESLFLVKNVQEIDTQPIIKEVLDMILSDTLRIARTEGMRAFREAQRLQNKEA